MDRYMTFDSNGTAYFTDNTDTEWQTFEVEDFFTDDEICCLCGAEIVSGWKCVETNEYKCDDCFHESN